MDHSQLAVLLLNANRVVALDKLVDELWENPPPTAAQAVQVYVSKLRKLLAHLIDVPEQNSSRNAQYVTPVS